MMSTFKAAFREIYNSLELKLNQHYGEKTQGGSLYSRVN